MNATTAQHLKAMLTGGLHVGDDYDQNDGCTIEAAIANVAAAQLRAVRMAMLMSEPDDVHLDEEGRGWCITDKFTRSDAVAAIGGVMALLQESHYIAETIRHALREPMPAEGGAP